MQTYFISDGLRIKIGRSANPPARLAALQTASTNPLTLLAVMAGNRESELHERFRDHRIRGEWFADVFEIRQFIASQQQEVLRPPFALWLKAQLGRPNGVGRFARLVLSDRSRTGSKLHQLLARYGISDERRRIIKALHREYRTNTQAL